MNNLGCSTRSLLGGFLLAVLMVACPANANAQGTTAISSPNANSTVTFQNLQRSFTVEFELDPAWTYFSLDLYQVVGGMPNLISSAQGTPTTVNDPTGKYEYTVATVARPPDGTGYELTLTVFRVVAKDQRVYKTVTVGNITAKTSP